MYAVIQAGGEQLRVSAGDKLTLERMDGELNSEVVFDKVLVLSSDEKTLIGRPYVEGASVKAEIIGNGKGRKVLVYKHIPKKANDKLTGHRQFFTTVQIKEIIGG